MDDLGNNNRVSQYADQQCALWSCRQTFLDGIDYCSVAHEVRADHDVRMFTPHSRHDRLALHEPHCSSQFRQGMFAGRTKVHTDFTEKNSRDCLPKQRRLHVLMEKKSRESLWKDEDDEGLGRAVERLNLGLQNLKKKTKLLVDKKSSKILTSVSKEIQMGFDSQTTYRGKRSDGESGSSHHDFEGQFMSEISKAMKKIKYLNISSVVLLEKVKMTVEACLESSFF
ncbi:unnamed protein product [Arabidopsis halleri]